MIAELNLESSALSLTSTLNQDVIDNFADYCLDTMDPSSSEPMVSYIKRFQNRGRETGPAEPCKHAVCSRTHPLNECCICPGPHFVHRCWHVLGLPDGIAAIKENFMKQHAVQDGPWKRQPHSNGSNDRPRHNQHNDPPPRNNDRPRVSAVLPHFEDQSIPESFDDARSYSSVTNTSVAAIQLRTPRSGPVLSSLRPSHGATTLTRNANGNQSVQQDAQWQEDPLQGYRSPLVNHFVQPPMVSSIVTETCPLLRPLPDDNPAFNDGILDALYQEHMVSRVAVLLPPCESLTHANYVWFHLDTGATCTVSHCLGESPHCPTPASVKCGTAADGPSHVVESLGYLIGNFETSNSKMIPFEIPDHATIPSFGFSTHDDANFNRVKILALIPGSFAATHLSEKNITSMHLLAINGVPIHTATDISDIIGDILDRKPEDAHCTLTGFNFFLVN
jgi:hypothetical protein